MMPVDVSAARGRIPTMQRKAWLWGPLSAPGLGLAAIVIAVDQAHKAWMLLVYRIADRVAEVEGGRVHLTSFLDLVYVKNMGVSYGLFVLDSPRGQWLLASFAVLAVLVMAVWLARGVTNRLVAVSLGLIMGGAASNAVDRLVLGGVADFFSLHALGYYWYVFNLADVAIVAGVIGLLYDSFSPSRNDASKAL